MRISFLLGLIALALHFTAMPACSMRMGVDLTESFGPNADEQLLIATGMMKAVAKLNPSARTPFAEYPTERTLVVDRVLFGQAVAKGTDLQFFVGGGGMDGSGDGRLVEAKPVLLILRKKKTEWVWATSIFFTLGPLHDGLVLKSLDDPRIVAMQRIVDIAGIPTDAARWERVQTILPHAQDDPELLGFLLSEQDYLFRGAQQDMASYMTGMTYNLDRHAPATVAFADQLLTGNDPFGGQGWTDTAWKKSIERQKLFAALAASVKPDDPSFPYIDYVKQSLAGKPVTWTMPSAPNPCDLSVNFGNSGSAKAGAGLVDNRWRYSSPPTIIVAQLSDSEAGRKKIKLLQVLSGFTIFSSTVEGRESTTSLPAGYYVLLMRGLFNGENFSFGKESLILGSVINALPLKSPDDPQIADFQQLLMLIGQPHEALWQRTLTNGYIILGPHEIEHPLITNFYLRSRASLIKELSAASDATLQRILTRPDQYPAELLLQADRLFTAKSSQNWAFKSFDWRTDAARAWATSPQRKTLLQSLLKRLPSDLQYYRQDIEETLKGMA